MPNWTDAQIRKIKDTIKSEELNKQTTVKKNKSDEK